MNRLQRGSIFVLLLCVSCGALAKDYSPSADEDTPWTSAEGGWSFQLDNDLFSTAHRDQDYSWGGTYTYSSPHPGRALSPLHATRNFIDKLFAFDASERTGWAPDIQSTQFGVIAMTPSSLRSAEPLFGDRPYASLFYATSSQIRVLDSGDSAHFSSFTVGILGLHLAEYLHRTVHKAIGNEQPLGWDHQISNGGEPTFRYDIAHQWLLNEPDSASTPELKFSVAGSAGWLTQATVALSGRWGRIQSPWWSFNSDLDQYTASPVAPVARLSKGTPAELYLFGGVRVRAVGYNALLQGQFRRSDVTIPPDDLSRAVGEAWVGFVTAWSDYSIVYSLHMTTTEIQRKPGERGIIWGGINFQKTF